MKIAELEINIMAVPQGYYLAQGISRDLNFKVGLPAPNQLKHKTLSNGLIDLITGIH